ncbi:putative LRR receptor-like serine/threonine-protein kinase [Dichanthelium oligosanthes]|uniref:Putative LRR receptor-like serine/threonine-protein kinase n=1 Tax=Dichanthelium oligosanthes TaxID=888268 RepID=A0A1E5VG71_9POAL|nr:putative LRR receptor-like serine/threonine-protein kinase [Dichanthelium oligosanthes]
MSVTNLSRLQIFDISVNEFSGVVPSTLGRLQYLEWFNLDNNMFEANNEQEWEFLTSLTNCRALQVLQIGWNRFAGELPSSLANLSTTLQELKIFNTSISGAIPPGIGNLIGLQQLFLGGSLLTGVIPVSIGKLTQLNKLYLGSNNLSASIPLSIGNLTGLVQLTVKANILDGPIPSNIGNLKKLSVLDLSNNNLSGVIPREIMNLSSLSMYLDLSDNLLEGPLPSEVGNLVNLGVLVLSRNRLSGMIPDRISNCIVLEILLMDGNLLQGNIPPVLKNIKGLALLKLTGNKLNGSIPWDLGGITNLQQLFLAHNNLSGTIPELLGNSTSLICLDLSFNNLQGEVPKYGVFKNLTGLSIVGNNDLCGGIPQLHLPKCPNSAARKKSKAMPMSIRIALPTVGAILVLISVLALAIFLYRRSKEAVQNRQLPPRFTDMELPMVSYNEILKGTDGFSEANLLGQGRHGSVYRGTVENGRVSVAVKDMRARVGDFGIARILNEAARRTSANSSSTIGIRGSIRYVAPEYGEGFEVSTHGDVYSLGIILIEMFIGRSPTDDIFRDGLSLHHFAEAALPDKVMDIADSKFWLYNEVNNSSATKTITGIKECLVAIIQLGVLCSKQSPRNRLSIGDATIEMHNIRDTYLGTWG